MKIIPWFGLLFLFTTSSAAADFSAEVESWNEQFYSAWRSRDIDALADLYTEDAEVIWIYQEGEPPLVAARTQVIERQNGNRSRGGSRDADRLVNRRCHRTSLPEPEGHNSQ